MRLGRGLSGGEIAILPKGIAATMARGIAKNAGGPLAALPRLRYQFSLFIMRLSLISQLVRARVAIQIACDPYI
jgi:hypothetical protein